jgi:hypothetical protein
MPRLEDDKARYFPGDNRLDYLDCFFKSGDGLFPRGLLSLLTFSEANRSRSGGALTQIRTALL